MKRVSTSLLAVVLVLGGFALFSAPATAAERRVRPARKVVSGHRTTSWKKAVRHKFRRFWRNGHFRSAKVHARHFRANHRRPFYRR